MEGFIPATIALIFLMWGDEWPLWTYFLGLGLALMAFTI